MIYFSLTSVHAITNTVCVDPIGAITFSIAILTIRIIALYDIAVDCHS